MWSSKIIHEKLHSKCQYHVQILTKYSSIWLNTYLYFTCFQHHKLETKTQHSIDYNLRNSSRWYFVLWYCISRYTYGYSSLNIKAIHDCVTSNIVHVTIFLSYIPFEISQCVEWTRHIKLNSNWKIVIRNIIKRLNVFSYKKNPSYKS